jgi:hypothetical protein
MTKPLASIEMAGNSNYEAKQCKMTGTEETGGSMDRWKVAVWPMMERRHPLHIESVCPSTLSSRHQVIRQQQQRDRQVHAGVEGGRLADAGDRLQGREKQ